MEKEYDLSNLALYMLKTVQVRLKDQTVKQGTLLPAEGGMMLDGQIMDAEAVEDIEYIAEVDDFHTYKGYGELGKIRFTAQDLRPDFQVTDLLYKEYDCVVACHLYLKDMEICAGDIRLVSKSRKLNYACAKTRTLLYKYDDGKTVIARLGGEEPDYYLQTESGEKLPLAQEHITMITKAPEVNDYLYVTLAGDSAEHQGLVSAVGGNMVVMIAPTGTPDYLDISKAVSIRYLGDAYQMKRAANGAVKNTILIRVGAASDENDYRYKQPPQADARYAKCVSDGDRVTFVPSINEKCFIAKDVEILASEAEEKPVQEAAGNEYFGVILNVDFSRENGFGYVGNCCVSKASGEGEPGNARFTRDMLDFTLEFNKRYIIKYTAVEEPGSKLRKITSLALHQVVDASRIGIINVAEDGTYEAVPLYRAAIKHYEDRDVDVYCRDGTVVSGILEAHNGTEITILTGMPEDGLRTVIPFAEITDIRIIGIVSWFSDNGTGYVDNAFFFHINELEQSVDAQYIHRGTQVSFCLRNTRKGTYVDCGVIRVLPEKYTTVYVTGYKNQKYTVIDADKYGKGLNFAEESYQIPYQLYNQFRDLDNEDYRAGMTIQRKDGVEQCTGIKTLDGRPKLRYGIATAFSQENNTVSIISPENYRRKAKTATYYLSQIGESDRLTDIEKRDYQILYYTQLKGGLIAATITWVDKKTFEKCAFGYLESYLADKSYGWIVGEEDRYKPFSKTTRVYCAYSAFIKPPEVQELCDKTAMFKVCYTLPSDFKPSAFAPHAPAKQVWFLEQVERSQKGRSPELPQAEPAPAPAAPAAPAGPVFASYQVDLKKEFPGEADETVTWHYAVMPIYLAKSFFIRLFRNYQNKKKPGVSPDFQTEMLIEIDATSESLRIEAEEFGKLNTTRSVYLVRYATTQVDGEETFADQYPLTVLCEYRKSCTRALTIENDILTVDAQQATAAAPQPGPKQEQVVPTAAPAYVKGETVMILTEEDCLSGEIEKVEEGLVTFLDGRKAEAQESDIFRFGVLTAVDDAMTLGVINGRTGFPVANMEPKTFNIVKNAKRRMLLCYTCRNGVINYIERISHEIRDKLPMQWQFGSVSDYSATVEERCICVNDNVKYYLSVDTAGYIQSLVKSDNIQGVPVFIKTVTCPIAGEKGLSLDCFAVDIHCRQETSRILYDAVADRFLAARSAARSEPLEGSYNILHSLADTEAEVLYRVSDDGRSLQAYIDGGDASTQTDLDGEDSGDEWTEDEQFVASKALFDTSLVRYLMEKIDLRKLHVPGHISLQEDGWPATNEQAAELAASYLGTRRTGSEETMAGIALVKRLPEDMHGEILSKAGSRSLEAIAWHTLRRHAAYIGKNISCVLGEYSYYENTILSDTNSVEKQKEELYKYFAQDFYSRVEMADMLWRLRKSKGRDRRKMKMDLHQLFRRNLIDETAATLVVHLLSLDEANVQYLIINENVLSDNDELTQKILSWGNQFDPTQEFGSVIAMLDYLRSLYRSDKNRFLREFRSVSKKPDIIEAAENVLQIVKGRFIQLINEDDAERFTCLQELCRQIVDNKHAGFIKYRAALLEGWDKVSELITRANAHPTQETTEMLLQTRVLAAIREQIASTLNDLLSMREYMPVIRCESNGSEIIEGQTSLILLVENGTVDHTNRQSALNVRLHLEVLSGLSSDSVPNEIVVPEKELLAGAPYTVLDNVPLSMDSMDGDTFSIAVSADFECSIGFRDREIREKRTMDCGILEFQLQSQETFTKNKNAVNYYLHPSEGAPLKETDIGDRNMFFGREQEMSDIWDAIVDEDLRLREGRAVMLYGQKKTGKTSLANQILGKIRHTEEVNQQAIIIRIPDIMEIAGGITALSQFTLNFYQFILDAFELVLCDHPDVEELLEEKELEIPDLTVKAEFAASSFQHFFRRFSKFDGGRHRVVLIIDEFTRLCTTLRDYPEYQQIPNFIKLFSEMGFIQIIIGHPNMMKALSTLGIINHTAEFSKRIELTGLKKEDAVDLIRKPMIRSFGYDVYDSPLGMRAIDMLLELSGCHPSVLMKLCNEMFLHFVSTDYQKIIHRDVTAMLHKYLERLDPSTTFDILVIEDGDVAEFFDNLPTYRYLKAVALQSLNYNNQDCDYNFVAEGLTREESYEIRDTLLMRRILAAGNGRIRIVTKLFLEYVRHKYKSL